MSTFILIDTMNMVHRAKHVTYGSIDDKVGMSMHILFNSIRKVWKEFNGDHIVFALEGRSWRKDYYPPYKKNRLIQRESRTQREKEDDEIFLEGVRDFCEFLDTKTNATVVQGKNVEADDLIAHWIEKHPEDNHIIISTDTDYYQLLSSKVVIYNGINNETITTEGVLNSAGNFVIDKKTKLPKQVGDPEWLLFEKCIRGDRSDNIFSAYPGVGLKSTKKRIGIKEAFEDRHNKGYAWNNFMLTKWEDHDENENRVLDCYERNVKLIDLTQQPEHIKMEMDDVFEEATSKEYVKNVGIHFMKYCAKWSLNELNKYPKDYGEMLNAGYKNIG